MHNDRDSIAFDYADTDVENSAASDRQREYIVTSIKVALVTSQVSLSRTNAGVDPYNSRLGKRPGAIWNGYRR